MNINWKLRFKNKATLAALIGCVVAFAYQVLGIFEIVPSISQTELVNIVGIVLNALAAFGVIVDPTTSGVSDSTRAMSYTKPN